MDILPIAEAEIISKKYSSITKRVLSFFRPRLENFGSGYSKLFIKLTFLDDAVLYLNDFVFLFPLAVADLCTIS